MDYKIGMDEKEITKEFEKLYKSIIADKKGSILNDKRKDSYQRILQMIKGNLFLNFVEKHFGKDKLEEIEKCLNLLN